MHRQNVSAPDLCSAPELLETPRLSLRPFCRDDASDLHAMLLESISELREYLWHLPWIAEKQTLESAKERCCKAQENFSMATDFAYLVTEKSSGRPVGSVGLHRTDWNLPKTEVGYWVRSSETGKGYASESVKLVTAWALNVLHAKRIELITDEHNMGSRAVAERCGFQLEGIIRHIAKAPDGSLRNHCSYAKLSASA